MPDSKPHKLTILNQFFLIHDQQNPAEAHRENFKKHLQIA